MQDVIDTKGLDEDGFRKDDGYNDLEQWQRNMMKRFMGEDWRDHITPEGAKLYYQTIAEEQEKRPDKIEDGDPCPVCGEAVRDMTHVMKGFCGKELATEKACIYESGEHLMVHFDDERIDAIEQNGTQHSEGEQC